MQKRLNILLEKVDAGDRVELVMVNNAFVAAANNYKSAATSANVKEYRSLKNELAALVGDLEEKYEVNESQECGPAIFKSKIAVHRWLEDSGWQISRSQFYDHCRDGLLRPDKKDGKYRLKAVEKYATLNCRRAETGQKTSDLEEKIREEKLNISLERERIGLEREKWDQEKRQGRYIAKADFEMAIVARAVTFMAHLNHSINSSVQDWIDLVEGDQQRAPELVDAIVQMVEQRMGDFAVDAEFDVILESNI